MTTLWYHQALALILVGALWGCTNPLLRQGAVAAADENLWRRLTQWRVWVPYLLNQAGSVLYYWTLGQSDLSLAVPICNALALVFSIVTSVFVVGEELRRPVGTVSGAVLVLVGVSMCLHDVNNNLGSNFSPIDGEL